MKIAVYSDIHDNLHNLRKAFKIMAERKIERALCLGDLNAPFVMKEIIKNGIKTDCIWGNNEGEKVRIMIDVLGSNGLVTMSDKTYTTYEIDGKKVMAIHYNDIPETLAKSGEFDAVFYGHDHQKSIKKVNNCLVANPGEIAAVATGTCTFIIWDTATNEAEFVEIENPVNPNLNKEGA